MKHTIPFLIALLVVPLARAQTFEVQLNLNTETRRNAGESPEPTSFYAWPFISAGDGLGDPLTQQVVVSSPSGHFQGYINHPNGWSASSTVFTDRGELEDELFNNGDWAIRDFTEISDGVFNGEQLYQFSVSGELGALDALIPTLIDDNAHELDHDAPVFTWHNPGGLFQAVNVYLYDRSGGGYAAVDWAVLDGDANSYAPTLSLNPGTPYRLEVNQRRDAGDSIWAGEPFGSEDFPYAWGFQADLNSIGIYEFTTVPEPHEYALAVGAGLIGFGLWRRQRRTARA